MRVRCRSADGPALGAEFDERLDDAALVREQEFAVERVEPVVERVEGVHAVHREVGEDAGGDERDERNTRDVNATPAVSTSHESVGVPGVHEDRQSHRSREDEVVEDGAMAALNPQAEYRIEVGERRRSEHDEHAPPVEIAAEEADGDDTADGDVNDGRRHTPLCDSVTMRVSSSPVDRLFRHGWERAAMEQDARAHLAERIAGEVTLSDDPGATLRKWRTDFGVSQTAVADELDVSSSVISDYESGRRESPGIGLVSRLVTALLDIDEARGGDRIRQYARVLSAGFEGDVVLDLREYPTTIPLADVWNAVDATELVAGDRDRVSGHTVINSIEAITKLSADDFYRLYGQSTNRVLAFTQVSRGESPLVALRVVNPTPNAVLLHGISEDELWEHAPALAKRDGFSLAVTEKDTDEMLDALREL